MTLEYKDMSELLEADRGAMAFYNSLPMSLQQKLYRGGVGAFAELYCAAGRAPAPALNAVSEVSAVSATEYTGLAASGGNVDSDERVSYGDILPSQVMPDRRETT